MSEQMTTETDYITSDAPAAAPLALRREEPAPIEPVRPRAIAQRPEAPIAPPQPGPRTSDTTGEIFGALARAQMGFGEVTKTRRAKIRPGFEYKYANLSDVMRAIGPALKAEGILPMQIPMGTRIYVRLVHGPSGEWIEGGLPLALPDYGSDVQRLGSALTYMRRYLLTLMLGVVADDEEDDDGAAAMPQARGRA